MFKLVGIEEFVVGKQQHKGDNTTLQLYFEPNLNAFDFVTAMQAFARFEVGPIYIFCDKLETALARS